MYELLGFMLLGDGVVCRLVVVRGRSDIVIVVIEM